MYIYFTHQVLARVSSCSGSDPTTPSPIRARASVDIYNLYGVTVPPFVDVQSSPERILSQAGPEDPAYDGQHSEGSLKHMGPRGAPAYVPRKERRCRVTEKTSPQKQVQIAASSNRDYVDLSRKVDMELVRAYKDSSTQVVKLTEGPSGFCVAMMKEGMITTEIPALALVPTKKVIEKVKANTFKQKPAGCLKKSRPGSAKVDCIACNHLCIYIYMYKNHTSTNKKAPAST